MGSHLGSTLANLFRVYFEKNWLQNCPFDFKSRTAGGKLMIFLFYSPAPEHLETFQNFSMLTCHLQ